MITLASNCCICFHKLLILEKIVLFLKGEIMSTGNTNIPQRIAYSLNEPLTHMAPYPIVALRAPTTNDKNYAIGTLWIYKTTNAAYILTSVVSNSATWEVISGGGADTFTSLTVTPGPTNITGATTVLGTTLINSTGAATTTVGNSGSALGLTGNVVTLTGKIAMPQGTGSSSVGISSAMIAGTTTVATTAVTSNSRIFLTANSPGGTEGTLSAPQASIVPGVSFVINSSSDTDTSNVNWLILD
jgi:hypothetical protein